MTPAATDVDSDTPHANAAPVTASAPARRNAISNPAASTTAPPAIGERNAPASPTVVWNATAVAATLAATTSRT